MKYVLDILREKLRFELQCEHDADEHIENSGGTHFATTKETMEKGIIKEGYSKWICRFEDGNEFDIGALIKEYAAQELAEYKTTIEQLLPIAEAYPKYLEGMDGWNLLNEKYKESIERARKLIKL